MVKTIRQAEELPLTEKVNEEPDIEAYMKSMKEMPAEIKAIFDSYTGTGFERLVQTCIKTDRNSVFSPSALYYALLLLNRISASESAAEIPEALAITPEQAKSIAEALRYVIKNHQLSVILSQASSLWMNDEAPLKTEAAKAISVSEDISSFLCTMGERETDAAITKWLNANTGNMLAENGAGIRTDRAMMFMLLNTIYFRAGWEDEFRKRNTKRGTFHESGEISSKCCFMYDETWSNLYSGKHFTAIDRLLNGGCHMRFILPNRGSSLQDVMQDQDTVDFLLHGKSPNEEYCIITERIPVLDIPCDMDLLPVLKELGIRSILDPETADFSPLTDFPTVLFSAEQRTRFKMDEKGVEGKTYVKFDCLCMGLPHTPPKKVDFTLDRPFLFSVLMNDRLPLFVGAVTRPGLCGR